MPRSRLTRRALFGATTCLAWNLRVRPSSAQPDWDSLPEIRATDAVVPPDLLRGQHYVLDPTVTTFAYMNRYTVTSDYGAFVAPSDARLRRLIREIAAIAQLKAIQETDAFKGAALDAGKSSLRSAKNLIDNPAGTLSAIPEGIGSIFDRANEQLRRSGHTRYEDDSAKQMLAVSSFKREYAAKTGVDVYSSNEILQKELNRLAWASVAGNMVLGGLSLATGALALKVASNVRIVEQARNIVESTPPSELSKRNRDQLNQMQVPDLVANGFLQNRWLSPRHQTIIVASMMAIGSVPGRGEFIAYVSEADTEDAALSFQQMAELIASYNALVAPVRQISIVLNLPIVATDKNSAVLLVPIDRLLWTERTAALAQNLAGSQLGLAIWVTGDASARAEAGLKQLELALVQRCGKQLPLLD
jgi:hypothetical protein